MKITCIPVTVYRNPRYDCTNSGISSRFDELLVACPEGFREVDSDNLPDNFCILENRTPFGENAPIPTIYPATVTESGEIIARKGWWMMGGNYGATSDSRFYDLIKGHFYGAVAIHDRMES